MLLLPHEFILHIVNVQKPLLQSEFNFIVLNFEFLRSHWCEVAVTNKQHILIFFNSPNLNQKMCALWPRYFLRDWVLGLVKLKTIYWWTGNRTFVRRGRNSCRIRRSRGERALSATYAVVWCLSALRAITLRPSTRKVFSSASQKLLVVKLTEFNW